MVGCVYVPLRSSVRLECEGTQPMLQLGVPLGCPWGPQPREYGREAVSYFCWSIRGVAALAKRAHHSIRQAIHTHRQGADTTPGLVVCSLASPPEVHKLIPSALLLSCVALKLYVLPKL